jgi:hypothetical protein
MEEAMDAKPAHQAGSRGEAASVLGQSFRPANINKSGESALPGSE